MLTIKEFKDRLGKRGGSLIACPDKLAGDTLLKLKNLPGYWRYEDRNVVFRPTASNVAYLANAFPTATWEEGLAADTHAEHLRAQEEAQEAARAVQEARDCPDMLPDPEGYEYARPPMRHQHNAFILSRTREAFGLFMEQGTGKTKVTLDTACYLYEQGEIEALIIVAWPNGVHRNWVDYELPEDMAHWPYAATWWSAKQTVAKRDEFAEVFRSEGRIRVFTFNVEAFTSPAAREAIEAILARFSCMFVIDQSASIKNHSAKRTKYLLKLAPLAKYRRILDGAPVAEGAEELYSQFKFLDENIIGHDTWTAFVNDFCNVNRDHEVIGYRNINRLQDLIAPHCFRVRADECMDLPPRVYKRWPFDLSVEERRVYEELRGAGLALFAPGATYGRDLRPGEDAPDPEDPDVIEEHRVMVKVLRLQQIAAGWWPKTEDRRLISGESSRLSALLALLEGNEGKALIFARFRADLDLIQETLGDQCVSYHGGVNEDDRARAKRRFMEDPSCRVFVGQPRTAGVGHTLTAARHVVFYNNDPSLRFREECEKRAHRKGLMHGLLIWDLVARGTMDAATIRTLRAKKELSNTIMQDPDNFFLQTE